MEAQNESRAAGLERLLQGQAPGNGELLDEITVGLDSLTGFWTSNICKPIFRQAGARSNASQAARAAGKPTLPRSC